MFTPPAGREEKKGGKSQIRKKKRIFCCFYGIYSRTLVSSGFFGREKCCKNGNDKWSRFSALPFPRAKIVFFITDGISFNLFLSFFAAVEYRDIVDRFYPSGWRTSPLCSLPGHQWRHCVLNWGSRERERERKGRRAACVFIPSGRDPSLPAERKEVGGGAVIRESFSHLSGNNSSFPFAKRREEEDSFHSRETLYRI